MSDPVDGINGSLQASEFGLPPEFGEAIENSKPFLPSRDLCRFWPRSRAG